MLLLMLLLMTLVRSSKAVVSPTSAGFSMQPENQTMNAVAAAMSSAAMMQNDKKIESWTPSQPELTQMLQQTYPPTVQPLMPANYYLPGNSYGPPPTTEFRSEHYAYPFEPNYAYPVSQPAPIDSALVPTAKHFVIVSFIGLLLLFAVIQNSIAAAKRKDALVEILSNRRKRDLLTSFETLTPEAESALKEDARVRCIQRTLCNENRKLREDLGVFGKVFAKYLTRSVQNSLKEVSPGWDRLVEDAADAGLRGEDCDVIYRDCNFEIPNDSSTFEEEEEE